MTLNVLTGKKKISVVFMCFYIFFYTILPVLHDSLEYLSVITFVLMFQVKWDARSTDPETVQRDQNDATKL